MILNWLIGFVGKDIFMQEAWCDSSLNLNQYLKLHKEGPLCLILCPTITRSATLWIQTKLLFLSCFVFKLSMVIASGKDVGHVRTEIHQPQTSIMAILSHY